MQNLEATGAFRELNPTEDRPDEEGTDRRDHRGQYKTRRRRLDTTGRATHDLLQRILRERRATIAPLLVALVVNAAAYVLIVRPMGVTSANAANRAQAAAATCGGCRAGLRGANAGHRTRRGAEGDLHVL